MRARVFTLRSQEGMRRAVARTLRVLYADVEVEHEIYEDDPVRIGHSFLQLLRASTVEVGSFTVEVEDQYGSWSYWDYSADIARAEHFLRLPHDAKEKIFPSVAIMNRMVIVPQGIRDALDVPSDFLYLFKPLDLQGVLSVDFGAKDAVSNAIARVGVELKREMVSLARRQMVMYRIPTPDLQTLSRLLEVDIDFLEGLRQEIQTPLPRLTAEVVSGAARLNRVSNVTIEVRNESEHPAGFVDIQVRAPFNGVKEPPTRYTDRFDFSTTSSPSSVVTLDILPRAVPYCPLEVLFLFDEMVDAVTFPIPLIVDVEIPQ